VITGTVHIGLDLSCQNIFDFLSVHRVEDIKLVFQRQAQFSDGQLESFQTPFYLGHRLSHYFFFLFFERAGKLFILTPFICRLAEALLIPVALVDLPPAIAPNNPACALLFALGISCTPFTRSSESVELRIVHIPADDSFQRHLPGPVIADPGRSRTMCAHAPVEQGLGQSPYRHQGIHTCGRFPLFTIRGRGHPDNRKLIIVISNLNLMSPGSSDHV
jgi:hypothetical protein